jgi:hypothetical protein
MNSSKFFKKSRNIFGTPLLQMKANTIKSLCKSSRFHFSMKIHAKKINLLDTISFNLNNLSNSQITQLETSENLKELESKLEDADVLGLLHNLSEINGLRRGVLPSLLNLNMIQLSCCSIEKCGISIKKNNY